MKGKYLLVAWVCFAVLAIGCSESSSHGKLYPPLVDGDLDAIADGDLDLDDEAAIEQENDGLSENDTGDAEPDVELTFPPEPEARVEYQLYGPTTKERPKPYNKLPFPYNYFAREDDGTPTGLRVNLKLKETPSIEFPNTNLIDTGLYLMRAERYVDAINTMDGFSPFAYQFFEVIPDVDPASLPAGPDESIADDSTVMLLNIDPDSPDFGQREPIWAERLDAFEFVEDKPYDESDPSTFEHLYYYVMTRPARPLSEQTRYALVVRRGLTDPEGAALEPSVDFRVVAGLLANDPNAPNHDALEYERERMADVFETLSSEPFNLPISDLLLAFDFTTQSITKDLENIRQRYEADALAPLEVNFDNNDDGQPDLYTQDTLGSAPFSRKPWVDWEHTGAVLHGTLKVSDFRLKRPVEWNENREGAFDYDENGEPIAQGVVEWPFWLYLPKNADLQPFPVVIEQHGINASKEAVVRLSGEHARRGFATITADFPWHGERETGFAPLDFVSISHPLKARASFMQAASEHMQMVRLIRNWDSAIGDIYPAGGDGKTDLSTEKIAYVGTSLGSIVGGITIAATKDLEAAVLNVGGGGLIDYVAGFLDDYNLTVIYPDYYIKQFSAIAQTILDAGDCINYTHLLNDPREGWPEKNVLTQESIEDETVPNRVTDNFARAAYLPQVGPVVNEVYGVEPQAAPVNRIGFMQFDPACHNTLWGHSCDGKPGVAETTERVREQLNHFIQTYFDNGTAQIIAPPKAK